MGGKRIGWILILLLLWGCSASESVSDGDGAVDDQGPRAEFAFRGRIAFQSNRDGDRDIYLLTKTRLRKLTDNTWHDEYPQWSPDGSRIAYTANPEGHYDLFVMNADGSQVTRITSSPKDEIEHAWFPDGKSLAFTIEERKGIRRRFSLWSVELETGKIERMLSDFPGYTALPNFSPSDPLMGFTGKKAIGWDVFMHDFRTGGTQALTQGGKACRPHFSPDGGKVAYVSAKADGKGDIWIMNPDGSEKQRLTERDETSDYFPSWSPDGKYIVFSSSLQHRIDRGAWSLFLVRVSTGTVIPLFKSGHRDLFPDWDWNSVPARRN